VGANIKINAPWTLKLGVALDQSPVRGAESRTVRLPDNDRTWLSAGLKFQAAKNDAIHFAYSFVKVKDADINNDQTALGRGVVNGTYHAHVNTFGLQWQHTF
jgi:long-chain fatty acid transport protein